MTPAGDFEGNCKESEKGGKGKTNSDPEPKGRGRAPNYPPPEKSAGFLVISQEMAKVLKLP
jgi:hypothetical protein